jgi:hypothetical protein
MARCLRLEAIKADLAFVQDSKITQRHCHSPWRSNRHTTNSRLKKLRLA